MEIAIVVVALVALATILVLVRVSRQRDAIARQRDEAARERDEAARQLGDLRVEHEARAAEIAKARQDLDTYFKGMAAEVLQANSQAFLQQAKEGKL